MTDFLPLFPLQLVVFPGENLNLHIFEPRYKQLIRECEENGITFGIPAYMKKEIMPYGTEMQLVGIEKRYPNGELDVRTKGLGIFKTITFYKTVQNKLYSGADISRIEDDEKGNVLYAKRIVDAIKELFSVLDIQKEVTEDYENFNSFDFAHQVGFSVEQEYEFLCITSEEERQKYMQEHLQKLLPVVRQMEEIRKKAQMNGHFRNVIPPDIA